MRLAPVVSLLAVALLAALAPSAVAKPSRSYYETTVVADTDADYSSNGGLDIVGVHVAERYSYDPDNQSGRNSVTFRIELRAPSDLRTLATAPGLAGQARFDFTLGYKVGGQSKQHVATVTVECTVSPPPGGGGVDCKDPVAAKPNAINATSVLIILDADANGLKPGAVISDVFAASAAFDANGQTTYHDVAPGDNANAPEGASLTPESFGGPFTFQGGYPFLQLDSYSALERFAVPGGTASYTLRLFIVEQVAIDRVILRFQTPPGWSVESTLGAEFGVTRGGQVFDVEFLVRAPLGLAEGSSHEVTAEAILINVGGRVVVPTTTTITSEKTTYPEFDFDLRTPGPFKAGTPTPFRVGVTRDGAPLERFEVSLDFIEGGKIVDTVGATYKADGEYEAEYTFPRGGSWTADAYVSEMSPSPHEEFPVQVAAKKKGLPGFEASIILAALVILFVPRRR